MAIIEQKYVPTTIGFKDAAEQAKLAKKYGGLNPVTMELKPFKAKPYSDSGAPLLCDMLQSITVAIENELVDDEKWPIQLFATPDVMNGFLAELESYDDSYRIVDSWWQALAALRGDLDEEGFVRCEEISEALATRVEELQEDGVELWTE